MNTEIEVLEERWFDFFFFYIGEPRGQTFRRTDKAVQGFFDMAIYNEMRDVELTSAVIYYYASFFWNGLYIYRTSSVCGERLTRAAG